MNEVLFVEVRCGSESEVELDPRCKAARAETHAADRITPVGCCIWKRVPRNTNLVCHRRGFGTDQSADLEHRYPGVIFLGAVLLPSHHQSANWFL